MIAVLLRRKRPSQATGRRREGGVAPSDRPGGEKQQDESPQDPEPVEENHAAREGTTKNPQVAVGARAEGLLFDEVRRLTRFSRKYGSDAGGGGGIGGG